MHFPLADCLCKHTGNKLSSGKVLGYGLKPATQHWRSRPHPLPQVPKPTGLAHVHAVPETRRNARRLNGHIRTPLRTYTARRCWQVPRYSYSTRYCVVTVRSLAIEYIISSRCRRATSFFLFHSVFLFRYPDPYTVLSEVVYPHHRRSFLHPPSLPDSLSAEPRDLLSRRRFRRGSTCWFAPSRLPFCESRTASTPAVSIVSAR